MEVILSGMASPRTYECFVCKRNGIDNDQVYLDGKDGEGRTKYLNEDMLAIILSTIAVSTQPANASSSTSYDQGYNAGRNDAPLIQTSMDKEGH